MSSNDQIIVAPFPEDLSKFAVWHDLCVDNPFNFSIKPISVHDTLEEAVRVAVKEVHESEYPVEYGMRVIPEVTEYVEMVWNEFPDYKYLGGVVAV